MADQTAVEALLAKLRESRLSSDERRTTLDSLRAALEPVTKDFFSSPTYGTGLNLIKTAISDGPNDVRRAVLQTLSSCIETGEFTTVSEDSAQFVVNELIASIEGFLRSTLKVQTARSVSAPSRSAVDVSSLPTSALRACAAALKTLHALLRFLPKQEKPSALPRDAISKGLNLSRLFDVIAPCLSAGVQVTRQTNGSIPRSASSLQAGAFSWNTQTRAGSSKSSQTFGPSSSSTSLYGIASTSRNYLDDSSAGETDRKSDKSESERSDFSTVSNASTSSRARKDECRQQEAMTKLIRQNSLHCLTELNRHESRALISRWEELLPDQPAPASNPRSAVTPASTIPRLSSSPSSSTFSLCTLIISDPSTSVRLAAMSALESILTHGTLQLSMAQERAQRALSFTSLSSQLAGCIVNVRSYLVLALQRAATAPRVSGSGEGAGYPSALAVVLLQLTRTFVVSTAKAKLVNSNASVLGGLIVPFASSGDPEIQGAAKRMLATLTATPPTANARKVSASSSNLPAIDNLQIQNATAANNVGESSQTKQMQSMVLLGEEVELTPEVCERMLEEAFEDAGQPVRDASSWAMFVKRIADSPSPLLSSEACERLLKIWRSLSAAAGKLPDQHCTVLATVPDLSKALSRHSALDPETVSSILRYVQTCCGDPDEAVRAAAVRVLGLLVLPPDSGFGQADPLTHTDKHQQRITTTLHEVLWGPSATTRSGLLHDNSSLVRQRASWAFSNSIESHLRSTSPLCPPTWLTYAQYCLEAGRDIEGVAVSACRASGSLLAMLPPMPSSEACSLGQKVLEQLCRVLGTSSKPPKNRWNAASALDRALSSDVVLTRAVGEDLMDRTVELLCSSLGEKVYKVQVSAANALLSLCVGAHKAASQDSIKERLELLGEARCKRIQGFATARLSELNSAAPSKESALYVDELKWLLSCIVACFPCPPSAPSSSA